MGIAGTQYDYRVEVHCPKIPRHASSRFNELLRTFKSSHPDVLLVVYEDSSTVRAGNANIPSGSSLQGGWLIPFAEFFGKPGAEEAEIEEF